VLAVCCVAVAAWSSTTDMGVSLTASGKVGSQGVLRTLQHPAGGVIADIFVQNGDSVEEGQELLILQDPEARAASGVLSVRKWILEATMARLTAEQQDQQTLVFPEMLLQQASKSPDVQEVLDSQQELFAKNRESYQSRMEIGERVLYQNQGTIRDLESQIKSMSTQLVLMENDLDAKRSLMDRGQYSRSDYLVLQERKSIHEDQIFETQALIARAQQNINDAQAQISKIESDRTEQISSALSSARTELTGVDQQIIVREESSNRIVIQSPWAGVISDLRFGTIGEVIAPDSPILDLIPLQAPLIIDTNIKAADISNVQVNMGARVVITTEDGSVLPYLEGRVLSISADSYFDQESGQDFYRAEIAVTPEELATMAEDTSIATGMDVAVGIDTGETSVLDYLLQPFADSYQKNIGLFN
jgi:HlyD family type I secretion membrane fusion protein